MRKPVTTRIDKSGKSKADAKVVEPEVRQEWSAGLPAIGLQRKQLMAVAARCPVGEDIQSMMFLLRQNCRLIVHQESVYTARWREQGSLERSERPCHAVRGGPAAESGPKKLHVLRIRIHPPHGLIDADTHLPALEWTEGLLLECAKSAIPHERGEKAGIQQ